MQQVTSGSKRFPAALASGFLAQDVHGHPARVAYDNGYIYDLFNPRAREYAFDGVRSGYIDPYGLRFWWLDCDEPCGGDMSKLVYNNGTWPAAFVGAAYPHMVDRMVWEGMRNVSGGGDDDGEGIVMLGRSAWAGSQRFGGAVWSGDTSSTFRDLNQQFRAGLNMVSCDELW